MMPECAVLGFMNDLVLALLSGESSSGDRYPFHVYSEWRFNGLTGDIYV